jgi:hypothetical protein
MDRRLHLQTMLEAALGSSNVYYQPPSNIAMVYPAIVYSRDDADTKFANNNPYSYVKRYEVTVIDQKKDSEIPDRIAHFPMCTFSRHFTANGLNHDVFSLYF